MPLAIALHIVSEVARALAYAHAFDDLGIVHRDVTPDNVMLAFSGEVKLVDFGIARSDVDATLTSTGHIVGRPIYTAPEVWEGAQADRRADIYSLGVVLWQLLTGRRIRGGAPGRRRARRPRRPRTIRTCPADLDAVVARALAPDPKQRYQHAAELQEALRAFVPPGFLAEPALAELLARHFDVPRERRMLAAEVERATRSLGVAEPNHEPAPDALQRRARSAATARRAPVPTPIRGHGRARSERSASRSRPASACAFGVAGRGTGRRARLGARPAVGGRPERAVGSSHAARRRT